MNEEIEKELSKSQEEVPFEEIAEEESSPLNEPVEDNDIGFTKKSSEKPKERLVERAPEKEKAFVSGKKAESTSEEVFEEEEIEEEMDFTKEKPDDAPEQEIGSGKKSSGAAEEFELPDEHAQMAAESFLGMADNLIDAGGGFFIKIRKHKDFYDFEEIVQVIDEQNEKNIRRIKLDEQDKMLLRPLLVAVIKRKAKTLTPEQQLLGVALSIIIKKSRVVMEIRAENEMLVERMLDIIRQERIQNSFNKAVENSSTGNENPEAAAKVDPANNKAGLGEVVEVAA